MKETERKEFVLDVTKTHFNYSLRTYPHCLIVFRYSLLSAAAVLGARFRGSADSCLLAEKANCNFDDPEAPPANYGRRRSRAVLYQLSGHYKPDRMKTKLKLNNVSNRSYKQNLKNKLIRAPLTLLMVLELLEPGSFHRAHVL